MRSNCLTSSWVGDDQRVPGVAGTPEREEPPGCQTFRETVSQDDVSWRKP